MARWYRLSMMALILVVCGCPPPSAPPFLRSDGLPKSAHVIQMPPYIPPEPPQYDPQTGRRIPEVFQPAGGGIPVVTPLGGHKPEGVRKPVVTQPDGH